MPQESKYEERFCDMLIDHMKNGDSFSSFCVVIGVGRRTLYNWKKNIPEFEIAYEIAWGHGLLYWENLLKAAVTKTSKKLVKEAEGQLEAKDIMAILKTRYREEYAERQEVHQTGSMQLGGMIGIGHLEGEDLRRALDEARTRRRELEDRIASYGGPNPFKDSDS